MGIFIRVYYWMAELALRREVVVVLVAGKGLEYASKGKVEITYANYRLKRLPRIQPVQGPGVSAELWLERDAVRCIIHSVAAMFRHRSKHRWYGVSYGIIYSMKIACSQHWDPLRTKCMLLHGICP